MSSLRPITIAGGGLAGLGLGVALRRDGIPVTIHEQFNYPQHRVCGEFMAGLKETTLERLGIQSCFADSKWHHSTVWVDQHRQSKPFILPSPARGISRFLLDQRLAELFLSLGGDLQTNSRLTVKQAPLDCIWATGKHKSPDSDWVGLKAHFRGLEMHSDLEIHFGNQSYVGLSAVEDDWINVCGLFPKQSIPRKCSELDTFFGTLENSGLGLVAKRLESLEMRIGSFKTVASFLPATILSSKVGIGIGDRFAMMPPFTGNGMTLALESAAVLLPVLTDYSRGNMNWDKAESLSRIRLSRSFKARLQRAGWLHPFLWNSRPRRSLLVLDRFGLLPWKTLYKLTH